ncbi:MAG: hypothetical protein MUP47_03600 [Phycisphaerae bacterium]|nr:hypothetical protein [Phycisphaerae bacterium]
MSKSFFQRLDEMMATLTAQRSLDDRWNALRPLLADPDIQREFWGQLRSPEWLPLLRQNGYFARPPEPETVSGGRVRWPSWPASKYLARMSPHAAAEVADIFLEVKTENASVIGDMIDAALAMPADVAASLVPPICRAAKDGSLWIDLKDVSDLCVQLAKGGQLDVAMNLADALFTPTFEDNRQKLSQRDEYWYKEGLKQAVPTLAARRPSALLPRLCDWLKAWVEAGKHVGPDFGSDSSYIWRPAIEEHEQNPDYDFAGVMVGFVREGFEEAVRSGGLSLEEALQIIERYPYLVFKRIRLHLIGEFADQDPDLARQAIMNRELFDDFQYKHEYATLVGRRLDLLSAQQRDEWFGWVDAGPDMSGFDEAIRKNLSREPTEEDRRSRIHYWQFERLHWVRAHLQGERREFYDRMLAEHGEPDMADLSFRTGGMRWGSESPMSVDDLTSKTFEEAVNAVSSWKSEKPRFVGPSIEGLASTFKQYVATNRREFSSHAQVLVGRPAIFVRGFISQMSEGAQAGCEIDVPGVLELCRWVLDRPIDERTTPEQEDETLVDKDWQWTRDEISDFVQSVSKAKSGDVPRYPMEGLRGPIWRLTESLYRDRAESYVVRDISKDDPRVHDYLDLGINSPRGKAIEAALEYARWVANHIKKSDGEQEVVPGGFDAMPEVREMLEWQFASENRSFEAMSVIGSRVGLIYWIDRKWLEKNAGPLFQLEGIEQAPPVAQGWAAWNAFLVWVRPHIEFYRIFKLQFAYAVGQAASVQLPERSGEQPMYHLGEHLVILYGRGQLGLDDDGGQLRRFVGNTNPDVRRHTIGFVGRSLKGDEKVPEDIVERFKALWDFYWAGPGKKDAKEKPNAWLFGPWFSCGQFPQQWALDRLGQFVEVTPTPEPDYAVAEKLAETAHIDLVKSVRILDRVVRWAQEGWRLHHWLDSAKVILKQAMITSGEAKEGATQLIDYLGRRGYTDFGDLLRQ